MLRASRAQLFKRIIESYGFFHPIIFVSTVKGADEEASDLDIIASIPSDMEGK